MNQCYNMAWNSVGRGVQLNIFYSPLKIRYPCSSKCWELWPRTATIQENESITTKWSIRESPNISFAPPGQLNIAKLLPQALSNEMSKSFLSSLNGWIRRPEGKFPLKHLYLPHNYIKTYVDTLESPILSQTHLKLTYSTRDREALMHANLIIKLTKLSMY